MFNRAVLAIAFLTPVTSTGFADDCQRDQRQLIDARPGHQTSHQIKFSYESRRERFNKTANRYVWCIESDKDNQNIVEYKWGDQKSEDRYLHVLIEPGRGAPKVTTDGSKSINGPRTIKFARKNRPDWKTIDTDTISSTKVGGVPASLPLVLAQVEKDDDALNQFRDADGLLQVDQLSSNRELFLRFLQREKNVFAGGSLTVTVPLSLRVAALLQANNYQEYNSSDFVRARAIIVSAITYTEATARLSYAVTVRPEANEGAAALQRLINDRQLSFAIFRSEGSPPSSVPVSSEPTVVRSFERVLVSERKIDGQPVMLVPAKLVIMIGHQALPFGSFATSVFALAQ